MATELQPPYVSAAIHTGKKGTVGAPARPIEPGAPRADPRACVGKQTARERADTTGTSFSASGDVTTQDGGAHQHNTAATCSSQKGQQHSTDSDPGSTTAPERGANHIGSRVSKRFDDIRHFCGGSVPFNRPVDTRPQAVAAHRRDEWPDMCPHSRYPHLVPIYNAVRKTGLPNAMSARIPVPSNLNIKAWEFYLGILGDRENILDFVRYGFPTGYVGPVSNTTGIPNHASATEFPDHIDDFLKKEMSMNGVVGPYRAPPFTPWCHVSPLMSREKGDTGKRRVITDMTFPEDSSVNAYIVKNGVYGFEQQHSLPTVEALSDIIRDIGTGTYLSSIDVSRAYKNFASDPLDWPLLCFSWREEYFCDLSMPFGARASSFHMQSVANCITDILKIHGIDSLMYLDDLIIISRNREDAWKHYDTAQQLLRDLGLPEATDKAQPPSQRVKWLGINIDAKAMTLSIPDNKLATILTQVKTVYATDRITKKQLQSLLGYLLFVAKCVRPTRTFVSRLLEALRGATKGYIIIDSAIRADLSWFIQFCSEWNGVGFISPREPTKVLLVDACLSGIGGTDGQRVYGQQIAQVEDGAANITEVEAANVVVALHTLLDDRDRGTHVRIRCDNLAAVSVSRTGRARNRVLQECARAAWMVQALLGVDLSYDHIPGQDTDVADALSRAHLNEGEQARAKAWEDHYHMHPVPPCMFFMINTSVPILSRSGNVVAPPAGYQAPGHSTGPRDHGEPKGGCGDLHRLHEKIQRRPQEAVGADNIRFPRVHSRTHASASHHPQQSVARQDLYTARWGENGSLGPPQGQAGAGLLRPGQNVSATKEGPTTGPRPDQGHGEPSGLGHRGSSEGSNSYYILRRPQTVRGRPPNNEQIRQVPPSDTRRHYIHPPGRVTSCEMGKKHAEGKRLQAGASAQGSWLQHVPCAGTHGQHCGGPNNKSNRPTADDTRLSSPCTSIPGQEGLGLGPAWDGSQHSNFFTPQSQEDSRYGSARTRMLRDRDSAPQGVEVHSIQNLYRHPNWQGDRRTRGRA